MQNLSNLDWLNLECNTEIPKSARSARDVAGVGGHLSCTKRKQRGTEGHLT